MDHEQLVIRLKKNDESAFEETIKIFTPLVSTIVYNIAYGKLSTADMEEVTSDTFVALWYHRDQIEPDKLKGYLCCIAKNKTKDKIKSVVRHQVIDIDEMDFQDDLMVDVDYENREVTDMLRNALDAIGDPDREIIIRHYYYYQSSTEISEKMQMKSETVKSRIKRAREKLKSILMGKGYVR